MRDIIKSINATSHILITLAIAFLQPIRPPCPPSSSYIMSTQVEDETQIEPEVAETNDADLEDDEDQEMEAQESDTEPPATVQVQNKKREKREPVELEREPGKSLLPFSRVQKIIKADKVTFVIKSLKAVMAHDGYR